MLLSCPHCQTKNRIPESRLDEDMACGRCHQPIFEGHVLSIGESDWLSFERHSKRLMVVDFWAEWCGPCKMIAPILDELAKDYDGRLRIAKMNVDENREVPAKFGIRGIPTLMLFKNGQLAATKEIGRAHV